MCCALQLEGRRFESTSSHCIVTMDKLLTHNSPTHLIPGGVKANEPAFGQRTITIIIIAFENSLYCSSDTLSNTEILATFLVCEFLKRISKK